MKILVIDDEPMICRLAEKILARDGHLAIICETGSAGLDEFAKDSQNIDAAIVDWQLPDTSGLEVVSGLRRIDPDLACILSSGNALRVSDIPESLRPNTYMLAKPYRSRELTDLISKISES